MARIVSVLRIVLLVLPILLQDVCAEAKVRLGVWTPPGFKYSFIVPMREGESLEHAVGRYQGALNMNKNLRNNLMPRDLNLKVGKLSELSAEGDGPRAVIVANKFEDMQKSQTYIGNVARPLRQQKIKTYVLPLAGTDLGLSREEADSARKAIRAGFDLYMGIGGDDIAPSIYRRKVDGARGDISYVRDRSEKMLMQEFGKGHGFIFSICRAHQMLGVANGCTLVQDIPTSFDTGIHADGWHKVVLDASDNGHLAEIFGGDQEVRVRSLHHQAINDADQSFSRVGGKRLRVVARSEEGIVEAVELRNGRGLGVQFHPELMNDEVIKKFFRYVAKQARLAYRKRAHGNGCQARYAELTYSP